jgi:V-type H+-transporting ATPase subunit a
MGSRYEFQDLGDPLFAEAARVRVQILEDRQLLKLSRQQLQEYLRSINGKCDKDHPSQLEMYHHFVAKEKALAACCNMMVRKENQFIGFVWCPFALEDVIKRELLEFPTTEFMRWRENPEEAHEIQPPTYFKNNDVTSAPQLITNTYGVPSYQEANPACFSVVTFPFLFAVMFGDYGHGSLILFAGLNLVLFKSYLEKYLPADVLKLRYMFLMMGFFSCYNGFLYNEWFAIPFPWFNSCYETGSLPTAD